VIRDKETLAERVRMGDEVRHEVVVAVHVPLPGLFVEGPGAVLLAGEGHAGRILLLVVAPDVVVAPFREPRMLVLMWLSTRSTSTRMPRLFAVRIISTKSPSVPNRSSTA
jgi:hypothetical protein